MENNMFFNRVNGKCRVTCSQGYLSPDKAHFYTIGIIVIFFLFLLEAGCIKASSGQDSVGYQDNKVTKKYAGFRPGHIWKDNNGLHINAHGGGLLFYEDKYYWFGEHKIEGRKGNTAHVGVHCYSSRDLYNWTDEGIALKVSDDPASDITKGCVLERPKVLYNKKTDKFVMWFHLELKGQGYSAARSGVAVGNAPTGPYTFIRSFRPNARIWPVNVTQEQKKPFDPGKYKDKKFSGTPDPILKDYNVLGRDYKTGQMARDMTLFVDDDGKAYHIYASEENGTLHISLLSDDYTEPVGQFIRVFENRWMEAPAICKRKGKYYLIASGCTGWAPNAARSAVADSIWGPWKELDNPCLGQGRDKTFGGQSTYILKVADRQNAYIALFDIWQPRNAIDGRYMWLPIEFTASGIQIRYLQQWDLSYFD
jgi:beta-xylosidase